MDRYDRGTSFFWLVFSIPVCIESLRLGVGTLQEPGQGFMAFGGSILLGVLSLILFVKTFFKKEKERIEPSFTGRLWRRTFVVLGSLVAYAKLMPVLGYLISTFFLMGFLLWVVRGTKWWGVVLFSLLTTLITYFVFSVWLQGQFPEGLFGF
jgi:putative tricarboxylic transport membrane protein